jgi:hypothetical protein
MVWYRLHKGIAYWNGMFRLDPKQTGLIIDYCLGLCSPSETQEAEELIAHSNPVATWHSQVQTALAFLSYLPVEPCPDYLADLTVHRLCELAGQSVRMKRPASTISRADARERVRNMAAALAIAASILIFAGTLISSLGSLRPRDPRQAPAQRLERVFVNTSRGDSDYAWPPILHESQAVEFMTQVPGSPLGVSGSAEYYLHRMDRLVELGPRVEPASWEYQLRQLSEDHLTGTSSAALSGQSR